MLKMLRLLAPVLHLTRVTTAFAAVANVWFVILWSRAEPLENHAETSMPLWLQLAGGVAVSVGLYAFAASLNDVLDARRDRTLNPDRPIPSGALSIETAFGLVVASLLIAMLGATVLGMAAVALCALTAAAVLFLNLVGRFVPSVGLVSLSLIYAAHMMIPNFSLRFLWPVWLVMTHALLVGAAAHVLAGRRPKLTPGACASAALGWAFWSTVLGVAAWRRTGQLWPEEIPISAALGPAGLAIGFILFAVFKSRRALTSRRAAEKVARYGALWIALYDTAWLIGAGHAREATIIGALAAAGFLGMTLLRELYGLVEQPVGYRR